MYAIRSYYGLKDEKGNPGDTLRGLYCTHCHNALSQRLYEFDVIKDPKKQTGQTLSYNFV